MANPDTTDQPSMAELEDTDRQQQFEILNTALDGNIIPPTALACLWLSDVEVLRQLVVRCQTSPFDLMSAFLHLEQSIKLVPKWAQRTRQLSPLKSAASSVQSSPPQQSGHPEKRKHESYPRDRDVKALCMERDMKKCVLTKSGAVDVAHIYPYSMRYEKDPGQRAVPCFWNALRMFWSKDRVDRWYAAIFPNIGTEVCYNMMCLGPHAHRYWEKAYFALKPIKLSEDQKRLELQFFWLTKGNREATILQLPPIPEHKDEGPDRTGLFNMETRKLIRSGDTIVLETQDPQTHPLPNFQLLEMQWILHRVTAWSAAAEAQDDPYDDSDDDLPTAIGQSLLDDVDMEDEWDDVDMRSSPPSFPFRPRTPLPAPPTTPSPSVPSLKIPSSSTAPTPSTAPAPTPSPRRPIPQRTLQFPEETLKVPEQGLTSPRPPEEEKFKLTILTDEEGLGGSNETDWRGD